MEYVSLKEGTEIIEANENLSVIRWKYIFVLKIAILGPSDIVCLERFPSHIFFLLFEKWHAFVQSLVETIFFFKQNELDTGRKKWSLQNSKILIYDWVCVFLLRPLSYPSPAALASKNKRITSTKSMPGDFSMCVRPLL